MPTGIYAECPKCGVKAFGEKEIKSVFSYRRNNTKPQSWCNNCRTNAKKVNKEK